VAVQRFMEASAIVLGASAIVLIFTPEMVLASLAIAPSPTAVPLAQLYGAALFGFSQTFWVARGMLLGGIYGRAVVVGGFANSFVGAFVLLHALRAARANPIVWTAFAVYVILAIAFGALMFGRGPAAPASPGSTPPR
jgi:hypothetical protein